MFNQRQLMNEDNNNTAYCNKVKLYRNLMTVFLMRTLL